MHFCGRDNDLKTIIERWKLSSKISNPEPQLVIITAERGLGKTRLALEFFQWLRESSILNKKNGYWPDILTNENSSLDVNADPYECNYNEPMPFLWWGIRAADPEVENFISSSAITSYDKFLAPHLVSLTIKKRAINSGVEVLKVWRDIIKGELASWSGYDSVMAVGEGMLKTVQIARGALNDVKSSPIDSVNKKSSFRIDSIMQDLETIMNINSPHFSETPAVIFIDDAQFSSTDSELAIFSEKLLHTAFTQRWPLLIIVTHWKRDLSPRFLKEEKSFAGVVFHARNNDTHQKGPAAGLPGGYLNSNNTLELNLGPVDDLSKSLSYTLPGLLPNQTNKILEHAGGNPRHLEQIITFLLENEDFFVDFNTSNPLTDDGLTEALNETHDIFKVVMRRLRDAPIEVQEAICISSFQGTRFISDITNDLAKTFLSADRKDALHKAIDPFSIISKKRASSIVEFSERLFYLVAEKRRRSLQSISDTSTLIKQLQNILRDRLAQITNNDIDDVDAAILTLSLAARFLAEEDINITLNSLSKITVLENNRYAYSSAVLSASRFIKIFDPHKINYDKINFEDALHVVDVLITEGNGEEANKFLQHMLHFYFQFDKSTASDEQLKNLSITLKKSGDAENSMGQVMAASDAWHKALEIDRLLVKKLGTAESLNDLCGSLSRVGAAAKMDGDIPAANGFFQEALQIRRNIAQTLPTIEHLGSLINALFSAGEVAKASDDLVYATKAWREALSISRDIARKLQTPDSLRDLWLALYTVGDVDRVSGDLITATQAWQEALEISRNLATKLQTPDSLRNLWLTLYTLGDAYRAAGDLQAATQAWQEALNISRNMATRLKTPDSLRDLSASLNMVGNAAKSAKDLTTAIKAWEESLDISREIAKRVKTPDSLRDLTVALDKMGFAAKDSGDLNTAKRFWQEALDINRERAVKLKNLDSLQDLTVSLDRLGDVLEASEDITHAINTWQESLKIKHDIYKEKTTPNVIFGLCVSYYKLAKAFKKMNSDTDFEEMFRKGKNLTKILSPEFRIKSELAFNELKTEKPV